MNKQTISEQRRIVEQHIDKKIILITGYSGAGKKTFLQALEDVGYFCIDNLTPSLLSSFFNGMNLAGEAGLQQIAIGFDVRGTRQVEEYLSIISQLDPTLKKNIHIVFIQCKKETLIRRFQETRRRHPLAEIGALEDAIALEEQLLIPLYQQAHSVVDTDSMTLHDVRHLVRHHFGSGQSNMVVTLTSFGFKYGVPKETNIVCDIRFLPNPYFIESLREYNGTHPAVSTFLFTNERVQEYWKHFHAFITYSIQQAQKEGRSFMHIAIGCTGGRHRSVAFVHSLAQLPIAQVQFVVKHRDIKKEMVNGEEERQI